MDSWRASGHPIPRPAQIPSVKESEKLGRDEEEGEEEEREKLDAAEVALEREESGWERG